MRKPFSFEGIVLTTAATLPTFKQPARQTRTYSGGILSPAPTFKSTARIAGRKYSTDYLAQKSPLKFTSLSPKRVRATAENFIKNYIHQIQNQLEKYGQLESITMFILTITV